MSKSTIKGLIPKLRFPEFKDAEPWEEKSLGDVASFFKGKGLPKSAITHDGKNLCIHYGELFTEYAEVIEKINNRTNVNSGFLSENNDVMMPTSDVTPNGLAKACCIKLDGVILGGDILIIRTNKFEVNGEFLSRYIRFKEQKVLQLVTGSTVFHLYASAIEKLAVVAPDIDEQQKIAYCLSSLDDLITAYTQKHDALKAHKKGLMQQLFPAIGKTTPKLRFPEFKDAGAWDETSLGKFVKILRGGSPRPIVDFLTFEDDGLNWLKIGDVAKDSKYIVSTEEKVKKTALSKTKEVNPGDLIMSNSMSFGRPYILKIKSCIHDGWIVFTEINKQINRDYLYYLILSPQSQTYFLNNAAGSGVHNLNINIIELLPAQIPKYLKEQQKIADCLSSIDDLITAHAQKCDALKVHKKGLMQQLFSVVK